MTFTSTSPSSHFVWPHLVLGHGPAIVFISQRFVDIFEQGFRHHGGVPINGIHQYPLVFCKVSYACVVSCFSPLVPIYKQAGRDWPYIKNPKSNESTLSNHNLSSNIQTSPPTRPSVLFSTHIPVSRQHQSSQNTNCDNQTQEPGSERRKKGFC